MTPRIAKFSIILVMLILSFFLSILYAAAANHGSPEWLKLVPPIEVSDEGFRGVMWCTPHRDIPWKMRGTWVHPRFLRIDEDYTVFGVTAKYITYTMRNTILYGVRIDIEGTGNVSKAMQAAKREYPPVGDVEKVNDRESRWSTKSTHVWVSLPEEENGIGQIYLWGRDRKFPDDSYTPVYHAVPLAFSGTHKLYKPRQYVVYKATAPITVDGNITEKAWQDAQWTEAFEDAQSPYCPQPWKMTRAKILYDDENMYFAARLQEENVWGHLTKRDTIAYYDNDFEIFLDPTADAVNYFEYEMNCLNMMFDMWHENDNYRNALADGSYDAPGLRSVVQVQGTLNYHYDTDEGWTVEVKIPFKDMQSHNPDMTKPKRGDMWRMNFSRVEFMHIYNQLFPYLYTSSVEDWVWASTFVGDLHIPEMWGKAIFSDLYAGSVLDEELENAYPILDPPKAPKGRKKGMVRFPACTITLGPDPTDPVHSPAHTVDVPEFEMDRYEVTVKEYCEFLNENGNAKYYDERMALPELCGIIEDAPGKYHVYPGREDYPVVFVSHDAAMAYAESKGKALPTEAMWERAARGLNGRTYPWGNEPVSPSLANYDFYYGGSLPVGSFPDGATPEGIYDLCGNVKEWTDSRFYGYPGGAEYKHWFNFPFFAPPYPQKNWNWVNRGGGWTTQEKHMVSGYRDSQAAQNAGFRCVRVKSQAFVPLFNGKDLTGWTGNTTGYVPEEGGRLVCYPDRGKGNLYTAEEFEDFVLRFEFKLTPGANNGLGIRAPLEGDAAYVGMELQIIDNSADQYKDLQPYQYHGSIYGVVPARRGFQKPVGEWNYEEVTVRGPQIKVVLNGETIVDADINEASKYGTIDHKDHPGLKRTKGHIGFLGHGSQLEFRNILIKKLK